MDIQTLVKTVIQAFEDAAKVVRRIQQQRDASDAPALPEEPINELLKSLELGPLIIRGQYDRNYTRFGEQYACGDMEACMQLQNVVINLQGALLAHFNRESMKGGGFDHVELRSIVDESRVHVASCMEQLSQRLSDPLKAQSAYHQPGSIVVNSPLTMQYSSKRSTYSSDFSQAETLTQSSDGNDIGDMNPWSDVPVTRSLTRGKGTSLLPLTFKRTAKPVVSIPIRDSTNLQHPQLSMGYHSLRSSLDPIPNEHLTDVPRHSTSSISLSMNTAKNMIPESMSIASSLTGPLILPTDKNTLGFCKGAIRLFVGLEKRALAINKRLVGMSGLIPYRKCKHCAFEEPCISNLPPGQKRSKAGKTYDLKVDECAGGGVLYRWAFLAKCHVSIRSAAELGTPEQQRGDYGTFGCIFCACEAQRRGWALSGNDIHRRTEGEKDEMKLGRNAASVESRAGGGTPMFGNVASFMEHLQLHRREEMRPGVEMLGRIKGVAGRVPEEGEQFDVVLLPIANALESPTASKEPERSSPGPDEVTKSSVPRPRSKIGESQNKLLMAEWEDMINMKPGDYGDVFGIGHQRTKTIDRNVEIIHEDLGKDLASTAQNQYQIRLAEAEKSSKQQSLTPYSTRSDKFVLEIRCWDHLKKFIKSEFDPPWHLDDVIIIVRDNDVHENTWCTSCRNYVSWRWGRFGCDILDFVNLLLAPNDTTGLDAGILPRADIPFTRTKKSSATVILQLLPRSDMLSILVEGPRQAAKEVADVLGWIHDSLRLPHDRLMHKRPAVVVMFETKAIHFVLTKSARGASFSKSECWHPLFPGKVVSSGRIPERPANMKGLEIDYQLLIAISGVDLPVVEEGGIYLDGYRSALYPILKDLPSESLQWHLETVEVPPTNDDDTETTYSERSNAKAKPSAWYKTRTLSELEIAKRHFVGWCPFAISTLGTSIQNLANLEWSDAKCHKRSITETTTNLNLNLAFHGVGATVGRSFKRGRNERNPYENHEENLRSALLNAKKSQVLLLRPSTQQAWLVPKTSVLLQLIQSYMTCLMEDEPSLSLPVHFAKASHDGGQSTYQVLWDYRNEVVPLNDAQNPCYLFNIVRMFLFALEKLTKLSEAGEVCGWEMRDLVDPPELFDMKRQGFRWRQLPWWGGWNQLLPEIRLVLYFEGLNDPIMAEEHHSCANCTKIPPGKNLLGITMISLKHFTRRFRSKYLNGSGQLTESCYWDSPARLFGRGCNGETHRCSAIQRIIKTDRCHAPSSDELKSGEEGAVIFEPCALSYEQTHVVSHEGGRTIPSGGHTDPEYHIYCDRCEERRMRGERIVAAS